MHEICYSYYIIALRLCFLRGLGALKDDDWEDFTGLTGRSSRLDLVWFENVK